MSQPQQIDRWWHPTVKKLASMRPIVWVISRTLHHADKLVFKATGGKQSAAAFLTGLPMVTMTTTGAKSGKPRSVPIVAFPDDDKLVFIASNWGQQKHPGWYFNIKANPQIVVSQNGWHKEYLASETNGQERNDCWELAVTAHPGYAAYEQRADGRTIPVILCTPIEG